MADERQRARFGASRGATRVADGAMQFDAHARDVTPSFPRARQRSAARFEFLDLLVERGGLLLHGADHAVVLVDGRVAYLDRTVLAIDDLREALQIDFTRGDEIL